MPRLIHTVSDWMISVSGTLPHTTSAFSVMSWILSACKTTNTTVPVAITIKLMLSRILMYNFSDDTYYLTYSCVDYTILAPMQWPSLPFWYIARDIDKSNFAYDTYYLTCCSLLHASSTYYCFSCDVTAGYSLPTCTILMQLIIDLVIFSIFTWQSWLWRLLVKALSIGDHIMKIWFSRNELDLSDCTIWCSRIDVDFKTDSPKIYKMDI